MHGIYHCIEWVFFLSPMPCESESHHQQCGDSIPQPRVWGSEQDRSVLCCLYILQREAREAQEQGSADQTRPCAWGHTVAGLARDPSSAAVQWSSPGTDAAAHRPSWQCLQCRSWWCTTASTWRRGIKIKGGTLPRERCQCHTHTTVEWQVETKC